MAKDSPHQIILDRKKALGERLIILGHHYQADEVIRHADFIGDSLELARKVSELREAQIIVFCGVLFMAQTAVILAPDKHIYIPDKQAGCPLADAAGIDDVLCAWEVIKKLGRVVPITYVNSSAEIKAFCGRNGGAVCTSGTALKILKWAFTQGDRVFFLPDQNLGRNTARTMDVPDELMATWDPQNPPLPKALENARIILWHGWCPVHAPIMTVKDVQKVRREHTDVRVIIHPEADPETVKASDAFGSTAQMIDYVKAQPLGTKVAIGTEINMVRRLSESYHAIVKVVPLVESACADMAKITPEKLARCLMELTDDYRVRVPEAVIADARRALDRMLKV